MLAVYLIMTTGGKTQAMIMKARAQEYVKRMTIVPIVTVNDLTNIATFVESPSYTI
jgi:hypothetical protein